MTDFGFVFLDFGGISDEFGFDLAELAFVFLNLRTSGFQSTCRILIFTQFPVISEILGNVSCHFGFF